MFTSRTASLVVAATVALATPVLCHSVGAQSPLPPPGLQCLQRYYSVTPQWAQGRWSARLADGTVHIWNDGRARTVQQMMEAPVLANLFAQRYRAGTIVAVTAPGHDPGRIRHQPLFTSRYGARAGDVDLVSIVVLGQRLRVNRAAQPAFLRVAQRLDALVGANPALRPFLEGLGGTFNWRNIAGTNRLSAHAFGISLDINVQRAAYWRWQKPAQPLSWRNQVPQAIVDAFEAEGFIWGGRWYHYDTMHFEYRPEMLDKTCWRAEDRGG